MEADLQLTGQVSNPVFTCPGGICIPPGRWLLRSIRIRKWTGSGPCASASAGSGQPDQLLYVTGGAAVALDFHLGQCLRLRSQWQSGGQRVQQFVVSMPAGPPAAASRLTSAVIGPARSSTCTWTSARSTRAQPIRRTTLTAQFNSHITDQLVRAGFNYKFDPLEADAPVLITNNEIPVAPWTWAGFYAGFNVGYEQWQLRYRHAAERRHDRQSAAIDERFFLQAARGDLWRSGRLQSGRRQLGWASSWISSARTNAGVCRIRLPRGRLHFVLAPADAPVTASMHKAWNGSAHCGARLGGVARP